MHVKQLNEVSNHSVSYTVEATALKRCSRTVRHIVAKQKGPLNLRLLLPEFGLIFEGNTPNLQVRPGSRRWCCGTTFCRGCPGEASSDLSSMEELDRIVGERFRKV